MWSRSHRSTARTKGVHLPLSDSNDSEKMEPAASRRRFGHAMKSKKPKVNRRRPPPILKHRRGKAHDRRIGSAAKTTCASYLRAGSVQRAVDANGSGKAHRHARGQAEIAGRTAAYALIGAAPGTVAAKCGAASRRGLSPGGQVLQIHDAQRLRRAGRSGHQQTGSGIAVGNLLPASDPALQRRMFRFLFRHSVYLSGCRAVMRRAAALDFPLFSGHIRQRGAISYVDD